MEIKRGQIAIEMAVLLVGLIVIMLVIIIFNREVIYTVSSQSRDVQAEAILDDIENTVEFTYLQGVGARQNIFLSFPEHLEEIHFCGSFVKIDNMFGQSYTRELPLNVTGTIAADKGGRWATIVENFGDYINVVGEEGYVCDNPVIIDFDCFPAGKIITSQYNFLGTSFTVDARGTAPDEIITFDTANPTGNPVDWDLGTPNEGFGGPGVGPGGAPGQPGENKIPLGMAIIIPKDVTDNDGNGLVDNPDDSEQGGNIFIDFIRLRYAIEEFSLISAKSAVVTINYEGGATFTDTFANGVNGVRRYNFSISPPLVTKITFDLSPAASGSCPFGYNNCKGGAIDDIVLCPLRE